MKDVFLFPLFGLPYRRKWKEKKKKKKKIYIYIYIYIWPLYSYKRTRCIKVMGNYITLSHTILFMLTHFFKTIFSLQILQIWTDFKYVAQQKWFLPFYLFHCNEIEEIIAFLLISLLFFSPPAFPNTLLQ